MAESSNGSFNARWRRPGHGADWKSAQQGAARPPVAAVPANRYFVLDTGSSDEEVIAALLRQLYAGIV